MFRGNLLDLFVINLCASMAPVPLAGKTLPGLDSYRLYQVSRVEDGRTRYRLRLGFFPSEADAESVLASVRERYPTAFCSCLADEDRKFTRGYLPDSASLSDTQIQKRTVSLVPDVPRPVATTAPAAAARSTAHPGGCERTRLPTRRDAERALCLPGDETAAEGTDRHCLDNESPHSNRLENVGLYARLF